MTATIAPPPAAPVPPPAPAPPPSSQLAEHTRAPAGGPAPTGARPPASPTLIALASGLSAAGAAWMIGGLFRDFSAHLVALTGVVIATGLIVLSYRLRRATLLQWLTAPLAFIVGLVLMAPDLGGGATLSRLVSDAVSGGGLLQPPVPFDPGWKVILVVLLAFVATGSASLAIGLQRPRLGVAFPLPLTMGAAIIQPASSQLTSAGVAIALTVAALSVAHGAELGRSGQVAGAFEVRRLARTGALAVGLFAAVAVVNSVGFLFPQPDRSHVIPPQPPPVSAPLSDRVLLTYTAKAPQPLSLGVIDVYDQAHSTWLLPEYDAGRLQRLQPPVDIPGVPPGPGSLLSIGMTMGNWDGHALPSVAGVTQVRGIDSTVSYDPRSGALSLADRPVTPGLRYTLLVQQPPTAQRLAAAGTPPASVQPFLAAPPPPNEVVVAIHDCRSAATQAHSGGDLFDILQCVRQKLYSTVTASGPGLPTAVPPSRVGQLFHKDAEASPYEIVASEALIARWVGIPARIGYGYYGGDKQPDGSYQIHPSHGATWLEAYFNGAGWVPIIGQPAHATASTSPAAKNSVPAIAANLQLILYIPYQRPNLVLLYEVVQYVVIRVIPAMLLVIALIAGYPWYLKRLRSRRRRKWALRAGLPERIAVAYAEMRDRARDLSAGDPSASPIAYLEHVADDAEHEEFAWLVSRALWGDLRRDLRAQDAVAAERWSRSIAARLDRAQPMVNRVLARISRASLREPYTLEVPNLWWELRPVAWLRRIFDVRAWRKPRRARRRLALGAGIAAVMLLGVSCGSATLAPRALPHKLVPNTAGGVRLASQPALAARFRAAGSDALINNGLVYTVAVGSVTYGDVQVELFRPDIVVDDINDESMSSHCADTPKDCPGHEVFQGIQEDFSGTFHRLYYDGERVYQLSLSDQSVYVWFPPHTEAMVMMVVLQRFGQAPSAGLMHALVDYEHGRPMAAFSVPSLVVGGSA